MPSTPYPRSRLGSLHELAATVLERRGLRVDSETLARDLLGGFYDACIRAGLDGVLLEIEERFAPLEISDGFVLADDERFRSALVAKLGDKTNYDPGGPRNIQPRQLADCLVASLSLPLSDDAARTITLDDTVRAEVTAALAGPVEVELAVPQIREAIIANARKLCEERYLGAFDKIAAQLDERGDRMLRQPKLPIDSVQAVQRVLAAAKRGLVERVATAAIDRARHVLERADAEAAARIDQPITHRLTPRDVAIQRATDGRVPMSPAAITQSLFASLSELVLLAWRPRELPVRAYSASQTFAVGDQLEHPKFGRGSVVAVATQRIDVEFADGQYTLVHARGK